ncbi:centromere protein S [Spodoptera frugiperda]|uniref:Centromere protein S n=1 Tax=Spodoptera frugiperda TaxID=7108 RepID=A0A9R0D556_SPOFR|nr:centromere protein S [Spodoptera frugiperda]
MSSFENLSSTQKIRAALHRDVRTIGSETCHFLGLEITKPAVEIVAELVYKKLAVYGADLEAFAKHAKRSTITADDVKLLVRRCPSLKSRLDAITPSPKEKRRKTVVGKPSETPVSKQRVLENTNAKQKDPEPSTSKQNVAENLKQDEKENETANFDNMDIDDDNMIDLTFD